MTGGPFQTPAMTTAVPILRPKTLDDLRAEIDAIDDSLHDLLMGRAALASDIARLKAASGAGPLFRPGREAAVVRRILARHRGPFPAASVVRIWREVMSSVLRLQGGSRDVCKVVAVQDAAYELARDHFGTGAAVKAVASAATAIRAVAARRATVAVLPWPSSKDDAWWPPLCKPGAARVVAAVPALSAPTALVVALQPPEPSGDDRSLIGFVPRETFSPQVLHNSLARGGFKGRLLARKKNAALFDVEGFVADGDPRLKALGDRPATVIGAYAAALETLSNGAA
jgi:chorismate mutase / prephenate dehydratase